MIIGEKEKSIKDDILLIPNIYWVIQKADLKKQYLSRSNNIFKNERKIKEEWNIDHEILFGTSF